MTAGELVPLSEEVMDLSEVGKTVDGTGFAYFRLDCIGKRVGDIALAAKYKHLRQIDMSHNSIKDVTPLVQLPSVLQLSLANNAIESISSWDVGAMFHLLYLDLSGNKLTELPALHMPALRKANFARNQITTCRNFAGHQEVRFLSLAENQLQDVEGLQSMPLLETLELNGNTLGHLSGLAGVPCLKSLDLSKNAFSTTEGPWSEMAALAAINLSSNQIAEVTKLLSLAQLPSLRQVQVAGNPVEEQEGVNLRLELLIVHGTLASINGEEVTDDEREEAKALHAKRVEEEEEKRRVEEEARLAALAAEAAGEGTAAE